MFNRAHAASVAVPVGRRAALHRRGHGAGARRDPDPRPGLVGRRLGRHRQQLQGRYRLHVIQVAGFAGAPVGANAEGPVIQPVVDALDGYPIKSAKLKSPAVIGHSMGGLMGLMLAASIRGRRPADGCRQPAVLRGDLLAPGHGRQCQAPGRRPARHGAASSPEQWAAGRARTMTRLVKSSAGLKAATEASIASSLLADRSRLYDDLTRTDLRRDRRDQDPDRDALPLGRGGGRAPGRPMAPSAPAPTLSMASAEGQGGSTVHCASSCWTSRPPIAAEVVAFRTLSGLPGRASNRNSDGMMILRRFALALAAPVVMARWRW